MQIGETSDFKRAGEVSRLQLDSLRTQKCLKTREGRQPFNGDWLTDSRLGALPLLTIDRVVGGYPLPFSKVLGHRKRKNETSFVLADLMFKFGVQGAEDWGSAPVKASASTRDLPWASYLSISKN